MEQQEYMTQTLDYIHSELGRIQTIAGTLASVEGDHARDLRSFGDNKLNQLAKEEQAAARQLGQVKQMCLVLAERLDEIRNSPVVTGLDRWGIDTADADKGE